MRAAAAVDETAHKVTKEGVKHTSQRAERPEDGVAVVATPTAELEARLQLQRAFRARLPGQQPPLSGRQAAVFAATGPLPRHAARLRHQLVRPATTQRVTARGARERLRADAAPEPGGGPAAVGAPAAPGTGPHLSFSCAGGTTAFSVAMAALSRLDAVAMHALSFRAAHFFNMLKPSVVSAPSGHRGKKILAAADSALQRLASTRVAVGAVQVTRFFRRASLGTARHVDTDFASFRIKALVSSGADSRSGGGGGGEDTDDGIEVASGSEADDADSDAPPSNRGVQSTPKVGLCCSSCNACRALPLLSLRRMQVQLIATRCSACRRRVREASAVVTLSFACSTPTASAL